MKFSDYLSIIALVIALYSLYRTYFHRKKDFKSVILDVSWDEGKRTTFLKLLYINQGNISEIVAGLNLNYYSRADWPDNYIGGYYGFGGSPFLPKIDPLIIPPESMKIEIYEFKLTAEEIEQIKEENERGKEVSAALKFKRITDKGYWFKKTFFQGMSSIGAPFTYSFCPDMIINLDPSLLDDSHFWVQKNHEKGQTPSLKVVLRYRFYRFKEWLMWKLRIHPDRKIWSKKATKAKKKKSAFQNNSSE